MGNFPKPVRDEALVLAARHCCSCRRFRAIHVEVHHLVPVSKGGTNELDNAITLCFDCHAAAGHYNDQHPRGTKYSPSELRLARDTWHAIVASGVIKEEPVGPDPILVRYLVDLDPFEQNGVEAAAEFPLLGTIGVHGGDAARYTHAYRRQLGGVTNTYPGLEAYRSRWRDLIDTEQQATDFPYYAAQRRVTRQEFDKVIAPKAPQLAELAYTHQVPINDLVIALAHSPDACGAGDDDLEIIEEEYHIRSVWPLLLAITNRSAEPIQLIELVGRGQGSGGFAPKAKGADPLQEMQLPIPRAPLAPQATAIIQLGNLLGSFGELERTDHYHAEVAVDGVGYRDLCYTSLRLDDALGYAGPLLLPQAVVVSTGQGMERIPIHGFDAALVYAVNTRWMMGCCPHLFAKVDDQWRYLTSLFTRDPGITTTETVPLPPGTSDVIIAELEDEVSWLTSVTAGGTCLAKDIIMHRGDSIHLQLNGVDVLTVAGGYTPPLVTLASRHHRNAVIRAELARLRKAEQKLTPA
jgi:hypothetical protein